MKASTFTLSEAHALQCELAREVLLSSGFLRLAVTGWSMLPTLWPGDTLLVERCESRAVAEGDIVLFARDRRFFVHRVIGSSVGDALQTRGDAMPQADPPVGSGDLLGKIISVLRNGRRLEPARKLPVGQRAVAAVVQKSELAARALVALHDMFQSSNETSSDRGIPCQN
jgi:hypothetical protein